MPLQITFNPQKKEEVQYYLELIETVAEKCDIQTAHAELSNKIKEVEELQDQIRQIQEDLSQKKRELSQAKEAKSQLLSNEQGYKKSISDLTSEREKSKVSNKQLVEEKDKLSKEKQALKEEKDKLSQQLEKEQKDWENPKKQYESNVSSKENRINELKELVDSLTKDLTSTKEQNEEIKKRNTELEQKLNIQNISTTTANKKFFKVNNGELESTLDGQRAQYTGLPQPDGTIQFIPNDRTFINSCKNRETHLRPFCDIESEKDDANNIETLRPGKATKNGSTLNIIEKPIIKLNKI